MITAIHKDGSKSNPENYRGICVMNSLLKLLCKMMNQRMYKFLKENNIIKAQIWFMNGNTINE